MRTILHVDMDAFFASIEQIDNPDYKDKPVVVGALPTDARGVVSTCSYEARKYGIHSAMPIKKAYSLCPQAIFVHPRMERYSEISRSIQNILNKYSPVLEAVSIDEAFLDMTGCEQFYKSLYDMGMSIKNEIYKETHLTASVGIAGNKFLAKLASDFKKPDGLTILSQQDVDPFLLDLKVNNLWGIGPKTEAKLKSFNIFTVKDIRKKSLQWLKLTFGSVGQHLFNLSRGIDNSSVQPCSRRKSISQEITFMNDIDDKKVIEDNLAKLIYNVALSLRLSKVYARTITVKVRFSNFNTHTRSKTMESATDDDLQLFYHAKNILASFNLTKQVRLLGVAASKLTESRQMSILEDKNFEKLNMIMDNINTRYKKTIISKGRFYF